MGAEEVCAKSCVRRFVARRFVAAAAIPAAIAETPVKIVALGDSLTAGLGLPEKDGFVPRLQAALTAKGIAAAIVNAGVSGDTAAGGLARLDWSVPEGTDAVILELGANDMLRGFKPQVTRDALDNDSAAPEGAPYRGSSLRHARGAQSRRRLRPILRDRSIPELAAKYGVLLYPFFLDGVAGDRSLNQHDGLHPDCRGRGHDRRRYSAESGGTHRPRSRGASVLKGCTSRAISACCACCDSPTRSWAVCVMPRLFTGLEIPRHVGESLAMMRGGLPGARWIDPENYHLTLRFIGDIDDALARDIAGLLGRVQRRPFEMRLDGLTSFGGRKPRAVVAAADAESPPLIELQAEQERLLQRLGLEPEGRKYHAACHAGAAARILKPAGRRLSARARALPLGVVRGVPLRAVLVALVGRRRALCRRGRLSA